MTTNHAFEAPRNHSEKSAQRTPKMFLLDPDDLPHMLHPEVAIRFRPGQDPRTQGVEFILIRNEDYIEPDDEYWLFRGLVLKCEVTPDYPALTVKERAVLVKHDFKVWCMPAGFPCPQCGGDATKSKEHKGDEQFSVYDCEECLELLALESRPDIENAAVLYISPEPLKRKRRRR